MPGVGYIAQARNAGDIRSAIRLPGARYIPDTWLQRLSSHLSPTWADGFSIEDEQGGMAAVTGTARLPITAPLFAAMPAQLVRRKLFEAGRLAKSHGAHVLGVAFDSWTVDSHLGDLSHELGLPVSNGLALEVAVIPRAVQLASQVSGRRLANLHVVVLSADTVIGEQVARVIGGAVGFLTIQGCDMSRLDRLSDRILHEQGTSVKVLMDPLAAVARADIVIACGTESADIDGRWLRPNAIYARCGCGLRVTNARHIRPGQVSVDQVLVAPPSRRIDGGGGLIPAQTAEALVVAMSGRQRSIGIGGRMTLEEVDGIWRDAHREGFTVAGFRSGSTLVLAHRSSSPSGE